MRGTDHPTESIPPAVTDRIVRWPVDNDDPEPAEADAGGHPASRAWERNPLPAVDAAVSEPCSVPGLGAPMPPVPMEIDGPLPPAADIWYPIPVATGNPIPHLSPVDRSHRHLTRPDGDRTPSSTMATAALVTSMISLPLALVGVGAILGLIATVLGVIALIQISVGRRPAPLPNRYRGIGRAAAGTVAGVASVIIGAPILLVVLMVLAIA